MADRNRVEFRFKAPRNPNGRAKYRLEFVPTRDLTARDVERLSAEELEAVESAKMPNGNKLYAKVGRRGKADNAPDGEPDEEEVEDEFDEDEAVESAVTALEAEQDAEADAERDAENAANDDGE